MESSLRSDFKQYVKALDVFANQVGLRLVD